MEGITYPVVVKDIPKFEKQNDISVNVFGYFIIFIIYNENNINVNNNVNSIGVQLFTFMLFSL